MSLELDDSIKWIEPNKLKPHPKNSNKHPAEQIERLANIIKYQGWRQPIVVSKRSDFIVAGHGRLDAAKKLGLHKVPVSFQHFDDETQELAHMVADNAIALWAELDVDAIKEQIPDFSEGFDLELLGLESLDDLLPKEDPYADKDADAVPEVVEPKAKLGQIYKLGEHRLMCGDSTSINAVEKLMNGEKADMVFTDPPYGINAIKSSGVLSARYTQYENEESDQCALDFINLCIARHDKIIAFGGNYFAHALPKSTHWVIWDKRGSEMEGGSKNGDQSDCEIAWTNLPKKNVKIYKHVWAGWFRSGNKKDELNSKIHPSQKPVGLFEKIFEDYPFESCFDGFGGSGSTLIACEKTNRKCFMMELDPHYVDVIIARWEQFTGKKAELIHG